MSDIGTLQFTEGFNILFDNLAGELSVNVTKKEVSAGETVEVEVVSENNQGEPAKAEIKKSGQFGTKVAGVVSGSQTEEVELREVGEIEIFAENSLAGLQHTEKFSLFDGETVGELQFTEGFNQ